MSVILVAHVRVFYSNVGIVLFAVNFDGAVVVFKRRDTVCCLGMVIPSFGNLVSVFNQFWDVESACIFFIGDIPAEELIEPFS